MQPADNPSRSLYPKGPVLALPIFPDEIFCILIPLLFFLYRIMSLALKRGTSFTVSNGLYERGARRNGPKDVARNIIRSAARGAATTATATILTIALQPVVTATTQTGKERKRFWASVKRKRGEGDEEESSAAPGATLELPTDSWLFGPSV